MFGFEKSLIKETESFLKDFNNKNNSLYPNFISLLKSYKKLFRQFARVMRISDKQQVELKKSKEAIDAYNKELRQEIHQRQIAEVKLQKANQELQRIAGLDGLTQIPNRRYFNTYLAKQWAIASREKTQLALILCDIDYFKLYNDFYGHLAGDDCLKQVAQAIKNTIKRPEDLAARYGGEEFVILLPKTNLTGALHITKAVLYSVRELNIPHHESKASNIVTISLGVAVRSPNQNFPSDQLIEEADQALYKAKDAGRNRLIAYNVWGIIPPDERF